MFKENQNNINTSSEVSLQDKLMRRMLDVGIEDDKIIATLSEFKDEDFSSKSNDIALEEIRELRNDIASLHQSNKSESITDIANSYNIRNKQEVQIMERIQDKITELEQLKANNGELIKEIDNRIDNAAKELEAIQSYN